MSKVAVVYWSSTGNTEAMANAVADGIREKGGEAVLHTCEDFDGSKVAVSNLPVKNTVSFVPSFFFSIFRLIFSLLFQIMSNFCSVSIFCLHLYIHSIHPDICKLLHY